MKKVVFVDKNLFPDIYKDYLEENVAALGGTVVFSSEKDEDKVAELCSDADAVIVCFYPITEKIINAMQHCSMIIRTGIGVDNIDVEAATKKAFR